MEPFIGEIRIFAGNFAPNKWATCDGQLVPISQNTALFSIIGTLYGGNGTTNFALPDLRGRAPMQYGQGSGLSPRDIGESGGVESVTVTQAQLPGHNHTLNAALDPAEQKVPGADRSLARSSSPVYGESPTDKEVTLDPGSLAPSGGQGQPHNNLQPYLSLTFIISLYGVYPARP